MFKHEHVSRWHSWKDKPGMRHTLTLWDPESFPSDIEELIKHVAGQQLYVFCTDILNPLEIPLELLKHEKSEPYMSKTGKVVALRVRTKYSGFFIPVSVWGIKREPNERHLGTIAKIFRYFDMEAITPASLSEKILRRTLPDKISISRPSHMLRTTLLEHRHGGRIDRAKRAKHTKLYGYDEIKAYCYHSHCVPSPFVTARYLVFNPDKPTHDRYRAYATAYLHCHLTVHDMGYVHPIQILDDTSDAMRTPREGETIDRWLWVEELDDCLEYGYTLNAVTEGYCFPEFSDFMQPWADILWNGYEKYSTDEEAKNIIKQMMVGLPGRFLKSPEVFTLVHESERQKGDIPINAMIWKKDAPSLYRPWFLRSEFDMQSAQLTPIGDYIVMKCRQELYHRMRDEQKNGNTVVSSYIDCYVTTQPSTLSLGEQRGEWKLENEYVNAWAVENQIIPEDIELMRSPGTSGDMRKALYYMYHQQERESNNETEIT